MLKVGMENAIAVSVPVDGGSGYYWVTVGY